MAATDFLIHRPWDEQPQEAVHIDTRWIDEGLVSAITRIAGGNGPVRDVRWQQAIPATDLTAYAANAQGAVADMTASQFIKFNDRPEYRLTGALTIICGLSVRSFSNYTHMASKNGTTPGDNTPFEFRHDSLTGNELTALRADPSTYSIWVSSGASSSLGYRVNALSYPDGALSSAPRMWQNGVELTVTNAALNSGTVSDNGQAIYVGVRQDNVTQFDGQLSFLWLFNRALNPDLIQELSWKPWRIFAPRRFLIRKSSTATFNPAWARGSNSLVCPGVFA